MKILSLSLSFLVFWGSVPAFCFELPAPSKEYFITAGDVINVNVQPAEEFSKEVTVQPDGTIDIPLIGPIKAAGARPEELEKLLTARFSKYVANPSITLNVRKFSSSRVAIIGQTNGTGYFEFREGMRLLDLVAQAGGTQDYARANKVRIYRKLVGEDGKIKEIVMPADLAAVYAGNMDKNILLAAGDIVYIPRKPYSTGAKWISDNFAPWMTLFTFIITASIVARKN